MAITQDDEVDTDTKLLRRANRLAASGDARAAIDLLMSANRERRRFAFEKRLVQLRHEAFEQLPRQSPAAAWPPTVDDPFPSTGTIPDIDVGDLSTEMIAGGILHHGSVIVRNLVPRTQARRLAADIDRAFAASDGARSGDAPAHQPPWYSPFKRFDGDPIGFGREFANDTGGVWVADTPRIMFDLIDLLEAIDLGPMLASYFGEPPTLSVMKWTLRKVPVLAGADWHQDGAFLGDDIRTVNLWLALSRCGDVAPGLDIVPRRLNGIVETGTNGAHFPWSVGDGTVEAVREDRAVERPIFRPGDAVLFDQRCLHRTAVSPAMSGARFAVESWFFAPSSYPTDQVPLVF